MAVKIIENKKIEGIYQGQRHPLPLGEKYVKLKHHHIGIREEEGIINLKAFYEVDHLISQLKLEKDDIIAHVQLGKLTVNNVPIHTNIENDFFQQIYNDPIQGTKKRMRKELDLSLKFKKKKVYNAVSSQVYFMDMYQKDQNKHVIKEPFFQMKGKHFDANLTKENLLRFPGTYGNYTKPKAFKDTGDSLVASMYAEVDLTNMPVKEVTLPIPLILNMLLNNQEHESLTHSVKFKYIPILYNEILKLFAKNKKPLSLCFSVQIIDGLVLLRGTYVKKKEVIYSFHFNKEKIKVQEHQFDQASNDAGIAKAINQSTKKNYTIIERIEEGFFTSITQALDCIKYLQQEFQKNFIGNVTIQPTTQDTFLIRQAISKTNHEEEVYIAKINLSSPKELHLFEFDNDRYDEHIEENYEDEEEGDLLQIYYNKSMEQELNEKEKTFSMDALNEKLSHSYVIGRLFAPDKDINVEYNFITFPCIIRENGKNTALYDEGFAWNCGRKYKSEDKTWQSITCNFSGKLRRSDKKLTNLLLSNFYKRIKEALIAKHHND